MGRKVVASILVIVSLALTAPSQMGMTARYAAMGQETGSEEPAEEGSQQAGPEEDDAAQESPAESGAADADLPEASEEPVTTPEQPVSEELPTITEAPADDAAAGGEAEEVTEQVGSDASAAVAEPEPEDMEPPAAGDESEGYTLAEVESIIGDGISLASLEELMPVAVDSGRTVSQEYFKFSVSNATGSSITSYGSYDELLSNGEGYVVGTWDGAISGDVSDEMFPTVEGKRFDALRLNGTVIQSIGIVEVSVLDEAGDQTAREYVYFSATSAEASVDATVLPDSLTSRYFFEVCYLPAEYDISYEVYLEDRDVSARYTPDAVFGVRRATVTRDGQVSFDVAIPAGYTGSVYVRDTGSAAQGTEVFPVDAGYGDHPLGQELVYKGNEAGAEIDAESGPGHYSTTGTYRLGGDAPVSAAQTIRVVLTEKKTYTFHPEYWLASIAADGKGACIDQDMQKTALSFDRGKSTSGNGIHVIVRDTGDYDLVWQFTTTTSGGDGKGWVLESLEVNGAGLHIPYVDYSGQKTVIPKSTVLPTGGFVNVTARMDGEPYTCTYYLTITGMTQDVVVTGGSLRPASAGHELVLEDSTGVTAQFLYCDKDGGDLKWVDAIQSVPAPAGMEQYGIHYNGGDETHHYANVRFQLKNGYEWRGGRVESGNVSFTDETDRPLAWRTSGDSGIYLDDDGWYYMRLGTGERPYDTAPEIGRLSITAEPARYVIQYLDGSAGALNEDVRFGAAGVQDMPAFVDGGLVQETWEGKDTAALDCNHGNYYGVAERTGGYSGSHWSDTVTVHGATPSDSADARPAQFQGWVVTDAAGNALTGSGAAAEREEQYLTYAPGSAISITDVTACGSLIDGQKRLYVIYLSANWQNRAPSYTYYITLNATTWDGSVQTRIPLGDVGDHFDADDIAVGGDAGESYGAQDWYAFRRDNYFQLNGGEKLKGLNVAYDPKNGQMKDLMEEFFPWYMYDTARNSQAYPNQFLWREVPNGGEVDVWLVSNQGELRVTNEVISRQASERNKLFPFTVTFTLPTDDAGTEGDETAYFGEAAPYKVFYTVTGAEGEQPLELESLGGGRYEGTFFLKSGQTSSFILPGDTVYSITEDVDTAMYIIDTDGETGLIQAASEAVTAGFINTPTGVVARKTQVETADAGGTEEVGTSARVLTVGSGVHVRYDITVTNRDEYSVAELAVKDLIPNADGDDGTRLKLTVELSSISGGGSYSESGGVEWRNVAIQPGSSITFSFTVTTPVVQNLNTYRNTANISYSYDDGSYGETATNQVTLSVEKNWLRIGKVLPQESRAAAGRTEFTFHIALSGPGLEDTYSYVGLVAAAYEDSDVQAPESGSLSFKEGTASVTLTEGQAIAIYGLPEGTRYTVQEEPMDGYRVSIESRGGEADIENGRASGTINDQANDWLIFTNAPEGVRVSKSQRVIRTGDAEAFVAVTPGDSIQYAITVTNIDQTMPTREVTVTDAVPEGLAVDTISDGGRQADGVITWTIPELGPGGERTVTFTAVVPEDAAEASFVNTASAVMAGGAEVRSDPVTAALQIGSLAVTKSVEGGPGPNADSFRFTVELTRGVDGSPLAGSYPYTSSMDAGNSGTVASGGAITLRKGETVTIMELPVDTRWTVTETGPRGLADHGYEGQASQSGTLTAREPDGYASFVNTWYGLYSLTYDGSGSTAGAPPVDGGRYREHESVSLRQPVAGFERDEAVFLGWSEARIDAPVTSREAAEAAHIVEKVEFAASDVTVFALWAADEDGDGVPDYEGSAGPGGAAPATGDSVRTDLWYAALIGCVANLAAICALLRRRRSK